MSVLICDALPGQGKTTACINLMNSDPKGKYIFVTQYLSEVERIKSACNGREFYTPEATYRTHFRKIDSVWELILSGKNIATTHALFESYTPEIKQAIKDWGYTLILDEVIDVMSVSRLAQDDVEILKRGQAIQEDENGLIRWELEDYDPAGLFREEMLKAKSKNFLRFMDQYFFWSIPPDLFTCFKNVYVLTYLFAGQPLRSFFEINGIQYSFIGVECVSGAYRFCEYRPKGRAIDLSRLIHILDSFGPNSIGKERGALSYTWYLKAFDEEGQPKLERLKKDLHNVLRNSFHTKDNLCMWTTYKQYESKLRGKGYWNGFVTYNKRASNSFARRRHLAYLVNNFPRPWELRYYKEHGASMCPDVYALCILVQWMFRSAIRNGEEIWIYVPSRRMRELLKLWIAELAKGKDVELALNLAKASESDRNTRRTIQKTIKKDSIQNKKFGDLQEFANSKSKGKRGGAKR